LTDFQPLVLGKVRQDFAGKLKTARLWGAAVYGGQLMQRDHVLNDSDMVELQL
jgi:ribosome-interacting GTPase 1